jgi:PIN domain nuclease of toxin-antitoxin system
MNSRNASAGFGRLVESRNRCAVDDEVLQLWRQQTNHRGPFDTLYLADEVEPEIGLATCDSLGAAVNHRLDDQLRS